MDSIGEKTIQAMVIFTVCVVVLSLCPTAFHAIAFVCVAALIFAAGALMDLMEEGDDL